MNYVIPVLATHFIFDWILQPRAIAKRKSSNWEWMFYHLIVIHAGFTLLAFLCGVSQWLVVLNTVVHGLQDKFIWSAFAKFRGPYTKEYLKYNKYAEDYWYFTTIAVDQFLHLALLMWIFS